MKKILKSKKELKNNKGITLVALIITVILMLILAGVAISSVIDSEGLFSKTREATGAYENAAKKENNTISNLMNYIKNFTKEPIKEEDADFVIRNVQDLKQFASMVEGGNNFEGKMVLVVNDIDWGAREQEDGTWTGETWTPIGIDINKAFSGTFEGQNHTIKGLYINAQDVNTGLFANNKGTIKDLGIIDSYIYSTNTKAITVDWSTADVFLSTGAIVGRNCEGGKIINCYNGSKVVANSKVNSSTSVGGVVGLNISNGFVENCNNMGKVEGNSVAQYFALSGVVGINENATVKNSNNQGEVKQINVAATSADYFGGVVGVNYINGYIENCKNTGNLTYDTTSTISYIGGVVGISNKTCEIKKCTNEGELNGSTTCSNGIYIGGVLGRNLNSSIITNLKNSGKMAGTLVATNNAFVGGGVAGSYETSTITEVVNEADIILTISCTNLYLGGVIGHQAASGTINESHNIGNIDISVKSSNQIFAAGVIGLNSGTVESTYNTGIIDVSGNIGVVSVRTRIGGIAACNSDSAILRTSYNKGNIIANVNSSANTIIGGVIGLNYANSRTGRCFNTGNITYTSAGDQLFIGGVAGDNENTSNIGYCYNRGNISGTSTNTGNIGLSGILGLSNVSSVMESCYSTGTVSCSKSAYIGGVAGWNLSGTISKCYYLTGTASANAGANSGTIDSTCGARTLTVMQGADFPAALNATYFKLDEDNLETEEDERINDGYPILHWE